MLLYVYLSTPPCYYLHTLHPPLPLSLTFSPSEDTGPLWPMCRHTNRYAQQFTTITLIYFINHILSSPLKTTRYANPKIRPRSKAANAFKEQLVCNQHQPTQAQPHPPPKSSTQSKHKKTTNNMPPVSTPQRITDTVPHLCAHDHHQRIRKYRLALQHVPRVEKRERNVFTTQTKTRRHKAIIKFGSPPFSQHIHKNTNHTNTLFSLFSIAPAGSYENKKNQKPNRSRPSTPEKAHHEHNRE